MGVSSIFSSTKFGKEYFSIILLKKDNHLLKIHYMYYLEYIRPHLLKVRYIDYIENISHYKSEWFH